MVTNTGLIGFIGGFPQVQSPVIDKSRTTESLFKQLCLLWIRIKPVPKGSFDRGHYFLASLSSVSLTQRDKVLFVPSALDLYESNWVLVTRIWGKRWFAGSSSLGLPIGFFVDFILKLYHTIWVNKKSLHIIYIGGTLSSELRGSANFPSTLIKTNCYGVNHDYTRFYHCSRFPRTIENTRLVLRVFGRSFGMEAWERKCGANSGYSPIIRKNGSGLYPIQSRGISHEQTYQNGYFDPKRHRNSGSISRVQKYQATDYQPEKREGASKSVVLFERPTRQGVIDNSRERIQSNCISRLMEEIRTGAHSVYALHAHLVFVTKYRFKVLQDYTLKTMEGICKDQCCQLEVDLVEFNGESDHVHLLVNYPPKISISKIVQQLKGVSSRKLKLHHPEIAKRYFKGHLWSPSYFAGSCGGAPLDILKDYVRNQDRPA